MNIMLFGNTGSGKSTLAKLLASRHNFKHVNTGRLTRMMASFGCRNLPILVQDMIKTMNPNDDHIFDHFYMHTYKQLDDLFGPPIVVAVEDRRTKREPVDSYKYQRFIDQLPRIHMFMATNRIVPIKVYNTDYGFDVSELIRADILPFSEFAVLKPEVPNEK